MDAHARVILVRPSGNCESRRWSARTPPSHRYWRWRGLSASRLRLLPNSRTWRQNGQLHSTIESNSHYVWQSYKSPKQTRRARSVVRVSRLDAVDRRWSAGQAKAAFWHASGGRKECLGTKGAQPRASRLNFTTVQAVKMLAPNFKISINKAM